MKEWRQKPHIFIAINRYLPVHIMLFGDDLVLLAISEDDLQ